MVRVLTTASLLRAFQPQSGVAVFQCLERPSADLCDAVASQNAFPDTYTVVEWREAAERECARAQGVGLGERVARTAKQPQGPAREPKRSEFIFLRGMLFH